MTLAHDLYSETNPGFCAVVLVNFANAYVSVNADGPEVPTAYLALPVALSGDLGQSFDRTNRKTSLLEWVERNPALQIDLAERVNESMQMVTEAVRFACFTRVLTLGEGARLNLGDRTPSKIATKGLGPESGDALKRAERLGYWFATAGSTRTVFSIMGLTL